ncbi:MAG TPA: tRNA pseudouridine(55) synthase TruB [Acidimicrobiales bacterium]|nr:tRNA pseudouridine(55) synthase TruB [Acidimicrobiales bacterium]
MTGPDGVAVVDKPAGCTSHDVVARARRHLGTKKVGHAGTLDPDATGVLVVGLGRATRLLRYVTDLPKSYEGEVVLGVATSTLDAAGEVVATADMAGVAPADVRAAAAGMVGSLLQVPPMVSAVQVGGRRLHELAREGVEVEREARPVTVWRFDVDAEVEPGVFRVAVECSSGTYVRSLAADLGTALGGVAHLRHLRRTAVGAFTEDRARPVEELELLPPLAAVGHLAPVAVDEEVAALVRTGRRLDRDGAAPFPGDGPWAVVAPDGSLLAVYRADGDRARPDVVLAG